MLQNTKQIPARSKHREEAFPVFTQKSTIYCVWQHFRRRSGRNAQKTQAKSRTVSLCVQIGRVGSACVGGVVVGGGRGGGAVVVVVVVVVVCSCCCCRATRQPQY